MFYNIETWSPCRTCTAPCDLCRRTGERSCNQTPENYFDRLFQVGIKYVVNVIIHTCVKISDYVHTQNYLGSTKAKFFEEILSEAKQNRNNKKFNADVFVR
jgi:hypothetical protein